MMQQLGDGSLLIGTPGKFALNPRRRRGYVALLAAEVGAAIDVCGSRGITAKTAVRCSPCGSASGITTSVMASARR